MSKMIRVLGCLLFGLLLVTCTDTQTIEEVLAGREHQSNEGLDWRDQVIYQVMVDRFENGDESNDFNVDPDIPARYHGGDWQGLIDRMGYFEELGVTTIWISPVVRNVEEDAGFASYHGYWAQDMIRPNLHFGDIMKLREFVDLAHSRGILVILDIVTNHMGQLFFYDINGNGRPDDTLIGGATSHTCVQVCGSPIRSSWCEENCLSGCRWECIGAECPAECSEEECSCDETCVQQCAGDFCNDACSEDECAYCREGFSYFERITEWDPEYDSRGIQGWSSLGFSGPAEIRFLYMPEINRTAPEPPPEWWLDRYSWDLDERGWFDLPFWYNRRGRVFTWWHEAPYSTEFIREQETLGDFPGGLKDLNTDDLIVRQALIRVFQYWIDVADFDGFRIDTLKHVDRPELNINDRGFWGEFCTRIREHAASVGKQNFFMFGEAFDGNDELTGTYTFPGTDENGDFGRLDSVFYFSQKYRVVNPVFQDGGPTNVVQQLYEERMGPEDGPGNYYDQAHATSEQGGIGLAPTQVLVNFLDNHDLERFLFRDDVTVEMLHNGLFYLLTWDGIPCIYYGTEQRFDGGNDPANREDMFLGNPEEGFTPFDTENETFRLTRDLISIRREHIALRRGGVVIRWVTSEPSSVDRRDTGILAFERVHDEETVLVVINTSTQHDSETCAPESDGGACMPVSFSGGTTLRDIAPGSSGDTFTVHSDGTINVSVPAQSTRILVTN